ncbi:MAG: DUF4293 domain-containing protein [Bacteroidales bacterium]|nr:DUF4293 domain-containing protein [Bacteroidales bacterium]MBD5246475.1 DUF4293 domain-containing protein [Barnesiella sp.]
MQIQRIQTVYLIITIILIGMFCTSSLGSLTVEESITQIMVKDYPVLLIVGIATAVLLLINIFLFKNLRLQKRVTLISMLLMATLCVSALFIIYGAVPGAQMLWVGGVLILIGAMLFALLAYNGMKKDEKKLRDSDRIR